jgi:hypothetical protein
MKLTHFAMLDKPGSINPIKPWDGRNYWEGSLRVRTYTRWRGDRSITTKELSRAGEELDAEGR